MNGYDFKGEDDADVAYKYFKNNRNFKDNIVFKKENITLEDFTSFNNYDIVHLSTHGENYCEVDKILKNKDGEVEWIDINTKGCFSRISTNIKHGFDNLARDKSQLEEFIKKYQNYLHVIDITTDEIYLKPLFFNYFYEAGITNNVTIEGEVKDKIWIFSACELGQNGMTRLVMQNILKDSHFFSWTNSVEFAPSVILFNEFYNNLINKGLDATKSFDKIPVHLRENIPFKKSETIVADKPNFTSLEHIKTGEPRHGIEIISMLNPEANNIVEKGSFYQLVGDFEDSKDEALTLKVKLVGYTKAEFLEKQMSLSLEVDGKTVLSKKPFLPDVEDDEITVKSINEHKYGLIVTIKDIAIPDVGEKEVLTLKASLHLNDKYISIHKEEVSIVADGIIATVQASGATVKYIYDDDAKAVKANGMGNLLYYDNEGYSYFRSPHHGWQKMNASELGMGLNIGKNMVQSWGLNIPMPSNSELKEVAAANTKLPAFIDFAINWQSKSFETNKEFTKTTITHRTKDDCSKFTGPQGMTVIFSPSGKLLELSFGNKMKIKYTYGNYNVTLPQATEMNIMEELQHQH